MKTSTKIKLVIAGMILGVGIYFLHPVERVHYLLEPDEVRVVVVDGPEVVIYEEE